MHWGWDFIRVKTSPQPLNRHKFCSNQLKMTQAFVKWLAARLLFVGYLAVTGWPVLLLKHFTDSDKPTPTLNLVCGLYGILIILASWWLSNNTAQHLIVERLLFVDAMKQTWSDSRLRLAFVPFIGPLFTPDEDKTKYDDEDDVRSFNSPTQE